jgi:AcrR family transcriptional regulator
VTETRTQAAAVAPRRTQAERRDESGRRLLCAAIAVVGEQGVSAATFEAIGGRAGFSRGLVSQRFGSKQALIEAVIDHLHEQQEAALEGAGIDSRPGFEALLAYVDLYLRGLAQDEAGRAYFMLLSAAVADIAVTRAAFAAEHARVERRLEAFVRRAQAEGDIRGDLDPAAAALMVGGLLLGLSMQLLVDPDTDLDPIRETSLATLRQSFGVRAVAGEPQR